MTDIPFPLGKSKFRVGDGIVFARAKVGRSVFDMPPPSIVERLAGLANDEIAERNRRLDKVNADLEEWRRKNNNADEWHEVTLPDGTKTRARIRLEYRDE